MLPTKLIVQLDICCSLSHGTLNVKELRKSFFVVFFPLVNPLLIYSHSNSVSECSVQSTALPGGLQPLAVLMRSINRGGLSIVSSPPTMLASHHRQPRSNIPTYSTSFALPPVFRSVSLCLAPSTLPPCSHTYPLTLNFAVKSPRAARAQRQMFPVEMRIDFSNGLCNQRFVHFHSDNKWQGASSQ